MATIKSTLALDDKMSQALTKVEKQAIANADAFNKLDKQANDIQKTLEKLDEAGKTNSTTAIQLSATYDSLRHTMEEYADGTRNAAIEEDNMEDATQALEASTSELELSIISVNQGLELAKKAWSALNNVMQEAIQWIEASNNQFNAQYTAAIKMHNVLGASNDEIQSMYDYAASLQKVGVVGDEATISGMSQLSMYTANINQVKQLTPAILDMVVANKGLETSQSDVEAGFQAIGAALNGSASRLQRTYGLTKKETDAIDKLKTKTERAAKLTEILNNHFGDANKTLAQTAQGGIMQVNNAMGDLEETLGEKVVPVMGAIKEAILKALAPAVQWLADNMSTIAPAFVTIVALIGMMVAALAILGIVIMLDTVLSITFVQVVMGGFLLIVSIIFLVIKIIEAATGESISLLGVIVGAISSAVAFINNLLMALFDFVLGIINGIANVFIAYGNFFANVWRDPVGSIAKLFLDLGDSILSVIEKIAKALDTVFKSKLSGAVKNLRKGLKGMVKTVAGKEYKNVMKNLDLKAEDFGMSSMDYGDAWNYGYNFGNSITNGIDTNLGGFDVNSILGDTMSDVMGDINLDDLSGTDSKGSKALKTTTNDKLEISDEDIKLLLDLATRDYKLNYQQVTPNITLTFGDVRETADVDQVLDAVADKLEEIYDADLTI